jgi:hypothetical protein
MAQRERYRTQVGIVDDEGTTERLTPAERPLAKLLGELGEGLGFDAKIEVEASESAWIDVVWFDKRLGLKALGYERPDLRHRPVLPVVGFELELPLPSLVWVPVWPPATEGGIVLKSIAPAVVMASHSRDQRRQWPRSGP